MDNAPEIFEKSNPWMRLALCVNIHVKKALLQVVHNEIKESQVTPIPSDPMALYTFLQNHKNKIQKSTHIKAHQKSILLPTNSQSVDSSSLDISLIRYLIQTFNGIKNANKDWKEPAPSDQTLCAFVFRAANFRNQICHDNDVEKMDETTFEKKWEELKKIFHGLKYAEDIEHFKTETLDYKKLQCVILEEFVDHLRSYKKECLNEPYRDDYIQRRFYVNRKSDIVSDHSSESNVDNIEKYDKKNNTVNESDLENIITKNDIVMIYAEAGMGKSSTAKRIKKDWCNQNILKDFNLLFFDSKKMNKRLTVQSHAAPLYFSELGDYLKKNGRIEDDLSIYSCVKTTIKNLVILIDGIDEFSIKELVTESYVDELERKVKDNELISGTETISAIYFGHLFPYSKVILFGRIGEFESFKKVKVKRDAAIFNRETKDLELLEFDNANIKDFTCLKICKQPSRQSICNGPCQEIFNRIEHIELCKNPTDLNSLIELHKKHPNENIGKITRTKLLIATIFNRLTNHIKHENNYIIKTFREINIENDFIKYLSYIRTLGEISFKSLLENNITVRVEEEQDSINGIVYLKYQNKISIERETLEELDLFYIRDLDYYFLLEPHHTLNIEFLCACYLFSHPDEWDSILELNKERQLIIIQFIAGLHADDYFSKDFVKNVLNTPSYSLKQFLSWFFNVEDVRESLPNGGGKYKCWFCLMENQKLSPSFFLLNSISQEVEIPQTFKINGLHINTSLDTSFSSYLNVNTLHIEYGLSCDSRTFDMMLNALSPPPTNTSSNIQPAFKCKRLGICDINIFNSQQTKKLFELCLYGVVDNIALAFTFFKDGQLAILSDVERKTNTLINIELWDVNFNDMFGLPNVGNRHVYLSNVRNVTDNDVIKLKAHIPPGYQNNLTNYKLIYPYVPFVRKENFLRDCKQSMFLNLYEVDFTQVSPEVFASTFSMIPSLSCADNDDDDDLIPSSHWLSLSQIDNCHLNEMRIWNPRSENFKHFLNIKTRVSQFICWRKDDLKQLLDYIVKNQDIQFDKQIKVFVVKVDRNDWDYYEEITLFYEKTIEESDDSLLDDVCLPYLDGEFQINWCCEISLPIEENIDSVAIVSDEENIDSVDIVSDDKMTSSCCCC